MGERPSERSAEERSVALPVMADATSIDLVWDGGWQVLFKRLSSKSYLGLSWPLIAAGTARELAPSLHDAEVCDHVEQLLSAAGYVIARRARPDKVDVPEWVQVVVTWDVISTPEPVKECAGTNRPRWNASTGARRTHENVPETNEARFLGPAQRAALRERAIAAWTSARDLAAAAQGLVADSRTVTSEARQLAGTARALRVIGEIAPSAVGRVEAVIRAPSDFCSDPKGLGLLVASRMSRAAPLEDALKEHLGRVWSARDPAAAVGMAISAQPDLAVVDDDLPLMTGLDTALLIRSYAPSTRVVLLSEDRTARTAGPAEGIIVAEPNLAPARVGAVLRDAMDR